MTRLREWWNRYIMSFLWFRVRPRWQRLNYPFKVRYRLLMGHTVCRWRGHRMGFSDRLQQSRMDCWRCWDPRVSERLIPNARYPQGVWYVKGDAPWPPG